MDMQKSFSSNENKSYYDALKEFDHAIIAREFLSTDPQNGLNAAYECCDRHFLDNVALRCIGSNGEKIVYTYGELKDRSSTLAHVLAELGVGRGDVVACLLPRTVELVVTMLAAWRLGAVYQPLFTAFGPKAIKHRLELSGSKVVVTDLQQRPKLRDVATDAKIICVNSSSERTVGSNDIDFYETQTTKARNYQSATLDREDLFLMMSTSGTTGPAKAVPVPLKALIPFGVYMRDGIGLRSNDVFWNIADPGWAYGLYYALIGPLLLGQAATFYQGSFTVESTFELIKSLKVTVFAGSPTAFRMMMTAEPGLIASIAGQLRSVSSAGEPLNPEVIRWFEAELNCPIRDHYGQTETGMIVNNHHGLQHTIKVGSSGFAMPGYRIAVIDDNGNQLPPKKQGLLSIDTENSPLFWFSGYYGKGNNLVGGRYYTTGDTVELDDDGSMFFVGRSDDVITSSGYRIGPFDVESALLEHHSVAEAAVIGFPDRERTEVVKAFVVLRAGNDGSTELAAELGLHVKKRLSAHAYPRIVEFVDSLPKTPSGKIQRFLLRQAASSNTR